jgi:hypothetical protein
MSGDVITALSVEEQVNSLFFLQIITTAENRAQEFDILSDLLRNWQMI